MTKNEALSEDLLRKYQRERDLAAGRCQAAICEIERKMKSLGIPTTPVVQHRLSASNGFFSRT